MEVALSIKDHKRSQNFQSLFIRTELKTLFDLFDQNGDGRISPQELTEMMHLTGHSF
jgi:Ca2+-binding EF-hand superfamily protein